MVPKGMPPKCLLGRGQGRAFGYTGMRNTLGTRSGNRENPGPAAFFPLSVPHYPPHYLSDTGA